MRANDEMLLRVPAAPRAVALIAAELGVCLHFEAHAHRFRLIEGKDALTTYTFNTGTARHLFCATCGIKAFYVPRSHPDGWSINARCIDSDTVTGMTITPIDGRNWEQQYPAGRGEFTFGARHRLPPTTSC